MVRELASALAILWFSSLSQAATISGGQLIEDFTSFDGADFQATTGLWNGVDHVAQAAVVAAGNSTLPISFGDGSDGALDINSGTYTFNTDGHPQGYNFTSVNIGAGATLSVKGSNPLIIRSLTTVSIAPLLSADGDFATGDTAPDGIPNGAVSAQPPQGGVGKACAGDGGYGGNNPTVATANDGTSGTAADGTSEGTQGLVASPDALSGQAGPGSAASFDSTGFVCGSGGGGGASQTNGTQYASGAAGGAGGGAIHIAAVGSLSVGTVSAQGGNGGKGAIYTGALCSGNGGGGSGGAVWLQTLKTLTATAVPSVGFGKGGNCGTTSSTGATGVVRCDSASPGYCGGGDMDSHLAASGQVSYVVQSKGYDLGTFNAAFSSPVVTSSPGSGTVSVTYAGSADGVRFSAFTRDMTSLSNKQYRYIKFQIQLTTASAAAASPTVSQIEIPFSDLGPSDLKVTLGCGTTSTPKNGNSGKGATLALFWSAILLGIYGWSRSRLVKGPSVF